MNIHFNKQYKAIQAGFEWKDIPNFAVITGVNGVGKSQLLDALNIHKEEYVSITNNVGEHESIVCTNKNANNQSLDKLIAYKNEFLNKQVRKDNLEKDIVRYSEQYEKALQAYKNASDKKERIRKQNDMYRYLGFVNNNKAEIEKLFEHAYDEELESVSRKLSKNIEDLTDDDVRLNANPYFTPLLDIDDFEHYLIQEHEYRKELGSQMLDNKDYDGFKMESEKELTYQKINRFFQHFGFNYFKMQNPFSEDKRHYGKVWFKGNMGEEVEYGELSDGKKMIVKFIFWAFGKDITGNRINTMLLDELDSHLHPSMCETMVRILSELSKPKVEGGSGIRIIITTHSPSTVAFTPEENLFVMKKDDTNNKRSIHNMSVEEAEDVLSEGILTYRKSIDTISFMVRSSHNNFLFVEGKTDVQHLKKAMEMLGEKLDVEVLSLNGVSNLEGFIKFTPSAFFGGKKMIALFDCDNEGLRSYGNIKGDASIIPNVKKLTSKNSDGKSFATTIVPYDSLLEHYCSIEFLYQMNYLVTDGKILELRDFQGYINEFKSTTPAELELLNKEYQDKSTLRPFVVRKDAKTIFANKVESETDPTLFEGFRPTLELIKEIIEKG